MSKARPIIFPSTFARAAILSAIGLTTATLYADTSATQTPFVKELLTHWSSFDGNNDGVISPDEVNKLVLDPSVTGDWGPALAATGVPHRDEAYGFIYAGVEGGRSS